MWVYNQWNYSFLLLILITINFIQFANTCDIVGASACPHKPDNDLKEENFEEYCNKYKQHIECVYKKYKGCDRKEKYVEAMESMVKGLRKKAKQIMELCENEIEIPLQTPKPVDNSNMLRNNGHTTPKKVSTGPPCKINTISTDCHPILTNVQFNPAWNGVLKQKWCNQATSYYNCIKSRLANCLGVQYMESLSYYEKIEKYIHSQSNLNCPGGLEGCVANPNDVRCKLGVKYGETSNANKLIIGSILKHSLFIFVILIFNFY